MGTRAQVRKGKDNERAVANAFKAVVPTAKRGLKQPRGGGEEEPDVVIPLLHIEAKHEEKGSVWAAMRQAEADCPPHKIPCVTIRQRRRPQLAVMHLADFVDLFGDVLAARATRDVCTPCGGTGKRVATYTVKGAPTAQMMECFDCHGTGKVLPK